MKRRRVFVGVFLVPAVLILALRLFTSGEPDLHFDFLEGRAPVRDQSDEFGWMMDGPVVFAHGKRSDDGPPSRSRQIEYTYQADYKALCAVANAEVLRRRGKEAEGYGDRRWELPGNISLYISPVRFDPRTGNEIDDPGWVRVMVHVYGEEGAWGRTIRWFRSLRR